MLRKLFDYSTPQCLILESLLFQLFQLLCPQNSPVQTSFAAFNAPLKLLVPLPCLCLTAHIFLLQKRNLIFLSFILIPLKISCNLSDGITSKVSNKLSSSRQYIKGAEYTQLQWRIREYRCLQKVMSRMFVSAFEAASSLPKLRIQGGKTEG